MVLEFKAPFYILSTDLKLDPKTIIEYYCLRWDIEVNYKYFKSNLGFDKYTVRSLKSIERYLVIEFLAINFLELYRLKNLKTTISTIGDTIRYHQNNAYRTLIQYIYLKAKSNYSFEDLCGKLLA